MVEYGHKPAELTQEALQQHGELTSTEVRQFHCQDCDISWWRVVLASKPVSRCNNCRMRYNALPRLWEFGVGRFTCTQAGCGHIFHSECYGADAEPCPKCDTQVQRPYIHPRHKHIKPPPSDFYIVGALVSSERHSQTGSTEETWLSQTAAHSRDPTPSLFSNPLSSSWNQHYSQIPDPNPSYLPLHSHYQPFPADNTSSYRQMRRPSSVDDLGQYEAKPFGFPRFPPHQRGYQNYPPFPNNPYSYPPMRRPSSVDDLGQYEAKPFGFPRFPPHQRGYQNYPPFPNNPYSYPPMRRPSSVGDFRQYEPDTYSYPPYPPYQSQYRNHPPLPNDPYSYPPIQRPSSVDYLGLHPNYNFPFHPFQGDSLYLPPITQPPGAYRSDWSLHPSSFLAGYTHPTYPGPYRYPPPIETNSGVADHRTSPSFLPISRHLSLTDVLSPSAEHPPVKRSQSVVRFQLHPTECTTVTSPGPPPTQRLRSSSRCSMDSLFGRAPSSRGSGMSFG